MEKSDRRSWMHRFLILLLSGGFFIFPVFGLTADEIASEEPEEEAIQASPVDGGNLTENDASIAQEEKIETEIKDLKTEIEEQQQAAEKLEKKIDQLHDNIKSRQREQITLETELLNLNDQIEAATLDIEKTEVDLGRLQLESDQVQAQIEEQEKDIQERREKLKKFIREAYELDQTTHLEVLMTGGSFSEFFSQATTIQQLQADVQSGVKEIKAFKSKLELALGQLESNQKEVEEKKTELDTMKSGYDAQATRKQTLLTDTEESEEKFQDLLQRAKEEFQAANDAIVSNERAIRKKLREKEELQSGEGDGTVPIEEVSDEPLLWPISSRLITAGFKDPDYPFRYLFEHPAVDVATSQGTVIKAAASGYVGIAKNGGATGYSYIMLVHASGISTVYGHASRIDVNVDDYVEQGQIIGLTGGMPGTPGAGRLTTGPHLHFEVRLDGIPVNPLNYLP